MWRKYGEYGENLANMEKFSPQVQFLIKPIFKNNRKADKKLQLFVSFKCATKFDFLSQFLIRFQHIN